jgi:hypothetical protein
VGDEDLPKATALLRDAGLELCTDEGVFRQARRVP